MKEENYINSEGERCDACNQLCCRAKEYYEKHNEEVANSKQSIKTLMSSKISKANQRSLKMMLYGIKTR